MDEHPSRVWLEEMIYMDNRNVGYHLYRKYCEFPKANFAVLDLESRKLVLELIAKYLHSTFEQNRNSSLELEHDAIIAYDKLINDKNRAEQLSDYDNANQIAKQIQALDEELKLDCITSSLPNWAEAAINLRSGRLYISEELKKLEKQLFEADILRIEYTQ